VFTYKLCLLQDTRTEKEDELEVIECCGEMTFLGNLASRVFLHQKATVQDAEEVIYTHTYMGRIVPQPA
jgi:hypothetical protein